MKKSVKEKNRIGVKWKVCILLMVAAVLLIPAARASASDLTRIDSSTFRGSPSISTIHIGSNVTDITAEAFKGLMNLRSITVSENNMFYTSYSNCLYNKDCSELLCFPAALTGAMIPESTVSIRENALYGVNDSIREQVRDVVNAQARENIMEWQVSEERFVHTSSGLKWKNADGTFSDPDTELKKLVAAVIDSSTTADMSQKKQLQKCFDFFVATSSYERKTDYPSGNWAPDYAREILSTGKGNCYNYAAAFAYVAKGLGYEARVCTGTVMSSLGGRAPHAWTEIRMGNNWYIFDTEMQGAKGSGYYKQTYDTYPAKPIQPLTSLAVSF